jgi:hypothetical protein
MLNTILANFYERDIRKMIEEISAFKNEENLWKVEGSIKNSAGNLALHIIGGSNFLFGATLAQTGYVRNRDEEFSKKNVDRKTILFQLEELIPLLRKTIISLDMEAEFPLIFDGAKRTNNYMMVQLLTHLNYHLGQVNYLRRVLE